MVNLHLDSMDLQLATKLDFCLEFFLTVVGNCLFLIIIHYERYEGDPMKRSILNQFISTICLMMMMGTLVMSWGLMLRLIFGGLPYFISTFIAGLCLFTLVEMLLNVMCICITKIFQKRWFSSGLKEDFWFVVAEAFNFTLSFLLTTKRFYVVKNHMPLVEALAGDQPKSAGKTGLLAMSLAIIGGVFLICWQVSSKLCRKTNNQIEPQQGVEVAAGAFNNKVHNPSVLNDLSISFIYALFLILACTPYLMTQGKLTVTADEVFLAWMPIRVGLGIVVPCLFFLCNKKLLKYATREFWDRAPEWLQTFNPNLLDLPQEDISLHSFSMAPSNSMETEVEAETVV